MEKNGMNINISSKDNALLQEQKSIPNSTIKANIFLLIVTPHCLLKVRCQLSILLLPCCQITVKMIFTTHAAIHAITHCHITTARAYLTPSSLFIAATAATQGV